MKESVFLTDLQKAAMAKMYGSGSSVKECAQLFQVEETTVRQWVRAAGVEIRPMYIVKRRYGCDENAFGQFTPESLYWLGFLLADGCIAVHKNRRCSQELRVSLQERDRGHLEKLQVFLKSTHPIRRDSRYAI